MYCLREEEIYDSAFEGFGEYNVLEFAMGGVGKFVKK